jgi:hypothetical protein
MSGQESWRESTLGCLWIYLSVSHNYILVHGYWYLCIDPNNDTILYSCKPTDKNNSLFNVFPKIACDSLICVAMSPSMTIYRWDCILWLWRYITTVPSLRFDELMVTQQRYPSICNIAAYCQGAVGYVLNAPWLYSLLYLTHICFLIIVYVFRSDQKTLLVTRMPSL